jgi:transposase
MRYFTGLDVGLKASALCVVDETGSVVREAKVDSSPEAITKALEGHVVETLVLETGGLSDWLASGLRKLGLKALVICARRARAAGEAVAVKTDRGDARLLAELARTGFYREVHVKSSEAQEGRALLVARAGLVEAARDAENRVRGLLRRFGVRLACLTGERFAARVREALQGLPETLGQAVEPMLEVAATARAGARELKAEITRRARADTTCQRLMSVPGVGPLVSYAYRMTIDEARRFATAKPVGAYLGLTPGRFQSGAMDRALPLSKAGDSLLRTLLYEGATSLLARSGKECALRRWGLRLAKRLGVRKARVAIARKLAVILHAIWIDGTWFEAEPGNRRAAI